MIKHKQIGKEHGVEIEGAGYHVSLTIDPLTVLGWLKRVIERIKERKHNDNSIDELGNG